MQINTINAALGRKVADFRKAHGWSQAQLADRFGAELGRPIDATTITRLEQGKRPVPVHELVALSHVLSVEPTVFFKFLGPLDDCLAALRFQANGLQAKAEVARVEADEVASMLERLENLRQYRETGDKANFAEGVAFLFASPRVDRQDWRELLLDAGVPGVSIDAALAAVPGAPGDDGYGDVRRQFVEALAQEVVFPPKRRRKTGKRY